MGRRHEGQAQQQAGQGRSEQRFTMGFMGSPCRLGRRSRPCRAAPEAAGFDAFGGARMAVQRQAERGCARVHVHAHDLDGAYRTSARLTCSSAQVSSALTSSVTIQLLVDTVRTRAGRVVAVATAGNLVDAANTLPQFAIAAAELEVLLQEGAAARREVGRQRIQVARVVLLAVGRPALGLLPDVEGEGVDALRRHVHHLRVLPERRSGGTWMVEALGRAPPPEAEQQRHRRTARRRPGAGLHVRLQVCDLVLESAHAVPRRRDRSGRRRRVDHQPERVMSCPAHALPARGSAARGATGAGGTARCRAGRASTAAAGRRPRRRRCRCRRRSAWAPWRCCA